MRVGASGRLVLVVDGCRHVDGNKGSAFSREAAATRW